MIWNRTGNSIAIGIGGVFLTLLSFSASPAFSENSSSGQAWKSCQSPDADKRVVGCTVIINENGGGSRSRLSDALDGRCWAYHVKGQYALAIADCKANIAIRPNYSYSYNNLGTAYLGIGDFANAVVVLSKAIDLKPNFVWSRLNRARAYIAIGKKDEAWRDYQVVLSLEPGNGEAKEAFGTMLTNSDGIPPNPAVPINSKPVTQLDASLPPTAPSLVRPPGSADQPIRRPQCHQRLPLYLVAG
jgi:tetratricopeptide (TPR) repeat protein